MSNLLAGDGADHRAMTSARTHFPPAVHGTHWETVSPDERGWDAGGLSDLLDWCASRNTSQLVILERGRIIAEHYWQGADEATSFDVGSVQKCVVSFVVGQLVASGALDVEVPASTWLGEGWTQATPDEEREILLWHLLTMTSGLYDDFGREATPGTVWYYNNNAYHQVRKVIEVVTGGSCGDVCAELLFEPIGMANSDWRERAAMQDPAGWALSGLHTTARDMARFGLAVIADGVWDGTELGCDPSFLAASLRGSQDLNPSYGYLWWVFGGDRAIVPGVRSGTRPDPRKSFGGIELAGRIAPSAPLDARSGMGLGDQRLYVVPSLGLVAVRHGGPAEDMAAVGGPFDEGFWRHLARALPTVENGGKRSDG